MDGFRTLKQGARVSFELVDGPKGKLAQNIAPLESRADPAAVRVPANDRELAAGH
ncbi:cold shock-like protein CspD [Methylibium sp. T29]|nr:cold shock-like protein CspD [Methylibium sp. T29]